MALSEDGDLLLAGSDDGTLSLWRVTAAVGGLDDRRAAAASAEEAAASGAQDLPDDDAQALREMGGGGSASRGGGGGRVDLGGGAFESPAAAGAGGKVRDARSGGGRLSDSIIRVFSTALGEEEVPLMGHPGVPGPLRVMYGHAAGVTCVAVRKELGVCASGGADGACVVHVLATGCALCRVAGPAPGGGAADVAPPPVSCVLVTRCGQVVASYGAGVRVATLWCAGARAGTVDVCVVVLVGGGDVLSAGVYYSCRVTRTFAYAFFCIAVSAHSRCAVKGHAGRARGRRVSCCCAAGLACVALRGRLQSRGHSGAHSADTTRSQGVCVGGGAPCGGVAVVL